VKLADCNDEYPTLKSVRPLAEPGSHAESGSGKTGHHSDARRSGYPPPMAAVRLYRRRDAEHPARRGAYMLDPVAFRQSVARVVGTRMKDATQGAACGNNPGKPVLRSMRNGAGVGAVQGGATGFVGGEILGGEVTGGCNWNSGSGPRRIRRGHLRSCERRFHSLELLQTGQPRSPASPCTHFGNKCIM
jgi:hypothetical protein